MPTFTLDGKQIEFKQGQTIISAARDAGIDIPHFCWHPAFTVAGNCRICLVEVEKLPKLVIACATPAAENMVVHSNNAKSIHAREAVMEFLLINHPLDCPICDEAGECKLQEYAYRHSIGESRFDEWKTKKEKRVELGPSVVFDQERCILCSRCIRYCEEIVKDPQLTFVQRGEDVTIETFPGKKLDNPYSMNVIEICPVGALTSKDFRFQARVWDLSKTESVCSGCARGCNMNIWVRDNTIYRLTPRENLDVNQYWMCDYGRLDTFKHINDKSTRLNSPAVKNSAGNLLEDVDWDIAISRAASHLGKVKPGEVAFIASAFTTLEDNFVLQRFANEVIGTSNICYIPDIDEKFGDDFLRQNDKTPNSAGVELLGINPISDEFVQRIQNKEIKLLYVMCDSITRLKNYSDLIKNIEYVITHVSNFFSPSPSERGQGGEAVIFPASTYAEMNGTIINFQGRVQRIKPAVATLETERLPGEFSTSRLDRFGAQNDRWTQGTKFNARPCWMVIAQIAKSLGTDFRYDNTEDVFDHLTRTVPAFSGLTYKIIGRHGILISESVTA